jgi:hypothetical protein
MTTQIWLAFGFGFGFLVTRLILAIRVPTPTSDQEAVFRTILSLSAAGIAASVPGLLQLKSEVAATTISATGALAVFVLVYLFNPGSTKQHAASEHDREPETVAELRREIDALRRRLGKDDVERANAWKRRDKAVVFVFATALVAIAILYAMVMPEPTQFQTVVVRLVFALAGAGVGAALPGLLDVGSSVATRSLFRITSALLLFLMIYFFARVGTQ